jgi:hypothetical protein
MHDLSTISGELTLHWSISGEVRATYHTEKGDPTCDQQVLGDYKITIKQDVDTRCCFFKNVNTVLQFVAILVLLYKL